jgi:YHS domain-containing protein
MTDALPQFDPQSRTLKTRFELENPGHLLQPEMFVDVELDVRMAPAITVPADAVFDSGRRKTVFVDRGNGSFEARRIETGWRLVDRVEVTKGLMEGERVVAAANFLLDSESRMSAAAAGILNPELDPVCGMEVDAKKVTAVGRTATHQGHTYLFCSDDCKKKFEAEPAKFAEPHRHEQAPPASKGSTASARPAAAQSAPAKDPVCGMDVDPKDPAIAGRKVEYGGKSYYFCSDDCKKSFEKNPAAYVK